MKDWEAREKIETLQRDIVSLRYFDQCRDRELDKIFKAIQRIYDYLNVIEEPVAAKFPNGKECHKELMLVRKEKSL